MSELKDFTIKLVVTGRMDDKVQYSMETIATKKMCQEIVLQLYKLLEKEFRSNQEGGGK